MSAKIESSNSLKYIKGMSVSFDFEKNHVIFKCGLLSRDSYDVSRLKIELKDNGSSNQYKFTFLDQESLNQIVLFISCVHKESVAFLNDHSVKDISRI